MPASLGWLIDRAFVCVVVALAGIAFFLLAIFNFLPSSQVGEPAALALFIVVTCLMVAGYALGFVALAFVGIFALTRFWQRIEKKPA